MGQFFNLYLCLDNIFYVGALVKNITEYLQWFGIRDQDIKVLQEKYGTNLDNDFYIPTPQQKLLIESMGYKQFLKYFYNISPTQ